MTTTIEVPVDDVMLRRAERVARRRQTTVAQILADAVQTIGETEVDVDTLPPNTRAALGLAEGGGPIRPYEEMLVDALMDRYGPGQ